MAPSIARQYAVDPADPDLALAELALRDRVVHSARLIAGGLAHDLNSPLQILGDAAYLLKEALDGIGATPSESAVNEIRMATVQVAQTFERLRSTGKSIAQLLPPADSATAVVRLDVELETVGALTRPEWHRDVDLVINADPRLSLVGIPRLLVRQLLIDLVLAVVRYAASASREAGQAVGERRGVELRSGMADDRVRVEVVAAGSATIPAPGLFLVPDADQPAVALEYARLLSHFSIDVGTAPGLARVDFPASSVAKDGAFF
ncbi:MAG TPA: hypothetical protein VMH39_16770 [Gemmatimonadaceae bacterium]|nr:hypothetical protein [Gemmatimonadaceae bacterium]